MDADQLLTPPQCRDPFIHHLRGEIIPPCGESEASLAQPTYRAPPTALLERLSTDQRSSFPQTWNCLPPHMREITFDSRSPGWTPAIILQLGEVLAELSDVFSKSSTDFGSCSLLPFEISVPPNSPPVTFRSYRINPPTAKKGDAVLDKFLTAGLIQHSTSPPASPVVFVPKKPGEIRITVNYNELDKLSILDQLPIPRVDEVLDKRGTGQTFSLFDLVSSFHQITVHKDTIPLTVFCTPTRLFERLVMPQGSSAAPGWFVKVINEVIKGLDRFAAYLDDTIVFDADPSLHVANMKFFLRLRKHNIKLSPSKATIGATDADFLRHTISPAGIMPNAQKWKR